MESMAEVTVEKRGDSQVEKKAAGWISGLPPPPTQIGSALGMTKKAPFTYAQMLSAYAWCTAKHTNQPQLPSESIDAMWNIMGVSQPN